MSIEKSNWKFEDFCLPLAENRGYRSNGKLVFKRKKIGPHEVVGTFRHDKLSRSICE